MQIGILLGFGHTHHPRLTQAVKSRFGAFLRCKALGGSTGSHQARGRAPNAVAERDALFTRWRTKKIAEAQRKFMGFNPRQYLAEGHEDNGTASTDSTAYFTRQIFVESCQSAAFATNGWLRRPLMMRTDRNLQLPRLGEMGKTQGKQQEND